MKNYYLEPDETNIMENYMELVVQYGYVIMFGQIFPLAAACSMISNYIQIKS